VSKIRSVTVKTDLPLNHFVLVIPENSQVSMIWDGRKVDLLETENAFLPLNWAWL
jgi:hypothetical protein